METLDKNMIVATSIEKDDRKFYNVKEKSFKL